ncbi:cytochrome C oxidase subunit II [Aphanothece hegewaldii CCALA 016]|uniref:Cytochrome c oxidase subunit 2 n=2 Tax=Aphanothece TaxID=1121 RepID=A0A2T1M0U8_9CHRO|nr:cytochrome c oxidase subunit II [Aphanothece hegewaldii]PSF38215.1 cytochrome C oxidase subunit II [Aphanothece hegewaldii CCALA 016]
MKSKDIVFLIFFAIFLALISWGMAIASYSWLPPEASAESKLIDNLFALFVFLGSFIFCGITGTILYLLFTRSVSRFDTSDGPHIEGNIPLEIVWTAIPVVLVLFLASYSYKTYEQMAIRGPMDLVHLDMPGMESAYAAPVEDQPTEEIEVEAKQWAWTFYYPQAKVTSSELHVPKDQRVRLKMQTNDVIHGFYVPAFRLKQDIIPNKIIDFEFTPTKEGSYLIQDSHFSGTYFAIMRSQVVVEPSQTYEKWLSDMATHPLVRAPNQAYKEYAIRSKPGIKTGWPTVAPADPPMVNSLE